MAIIENNVMMWNQEYEQGKWNFLEQHAVEKNRSACIAMYCRHFASEGSVLDIGCGTGVLYDFLSPIQQLNYVGIDVSKIAAEQALLVRNLKIKCADAKSFEADQTFNIIIFNEVLYYLNYEQIIPKYLNFLSKNGIIIISSFRIKGIINKWKFSKMWKIADRYCICDEKVLIRTHSKNISLTWDIKIFSRRNQNQI